MPIDERARHELYLAIEALVGAERADTLMDLLPPVGWADVATKHDLTAVEARLGLRFEAIDLRFESMEHRFDAKLESLGAKFEHELRDQTRALLFGLVTAMAAMASLCIAALALAR
jgi:hypothetical protein